MPTFGEVKNWYDAKYKRDGVDSMRPYEAYSVFLDCINAKQGRCLLDVSCGTGFLLLAAAKKGLHTFGVDISEEAVNIAKRVSPTSNIIVGQGEDLRFADNTFEYITCLGALEHFLDMEKGLSEMLRVAKEDAVFCIMVPNRDYLFGKITGEVGTEQQDINERLLTFAEWRDLFTANGFKILKTYQDKWFMKNIKVLSSRNPFVVFKRMIAKLIWTFMPLRYAYQFIFVLKKA